jgi:hypothetical protein
MAGYYDHYNTLPNDRYGMTRGEKGNGVDFN